ncbi:MAG: type II toxin-antitoxin system VapC family toxin [Caldilineaceae bacterium]
MTNYLLDTNILIQQLRSRPTLVDLATRLPDQDGMYISAITYAEVMAGMHVHEDARTQHTLNACVCLPVNQFIADQAGRWIYQYARRGLQLTLADALIAATAHMEQLTLVTTNTRHFPMPELKLRTL